MNNNTEYWLAAKANPKDLLQKAKVLNLIRGFVSIISNRNDIRVIYHSEDSSYTDGKTITISDIDASTNYDIIVGLALHESSHIWLTDFKVWNEILSEQSVKENFKQYIPAYSVEKITVWLKTLINVIEDRRIDATVQNKFKGYIGYYDALYNTYFGADIITKGLNSGNYRNPDKVADYMFRIINCLNPASKQNEDALPVLKQCYDLIDLDNISRLKTTKQVADIGVEMLKLILDSIKNPKANTTPKQKKTNTLTKQEADQLKNVLDAINDLINGKTKKSKIKSKLSDVITELSGGMDDCKIDTGDDVIGKVATVVYRGLNQRVIDNYMFPDLSSTHHHVYSVLGIEGGIKLGRKLKDQLETRDERKTINTVNLRSGKLNIGKISQFSFNDKLFKKTNIETAEEIYVCLTLDGSGSMLGTAWQNCLQTATSLMVATENSPTIHLQVNVRGIFDDKPFTWIIYDSKKDNLKTILELMKHLIPHSSTPEGLCFQTIKDEIIMNSRHKKSFFINISDGAPWFCVGKLQYGNLSAETHTKKMVREIANSGVSILSYYVSNRTWGNEDEIASFKNMYAKSAEFIDVTQLGQLSKTLNKLFARNI